MGKIMIRVFGIALIFVIIGSQPSQAQPKKAPETSFKFSKSGLEVANPLQMVLFIEFSEYLDETVKSLGLTQEILRQECVSRLNRSEIEVMQGFQRSEYLQVSVTVKYRSFYILIQFNRPVLFESGEAKYMKYGAKTWQKSTLGQHGYAPEHILERLGALLDDFIADYKSANGSK
jgi:hypothetical protein